MPRNRARSIIHRAAMTAIDGMGLYFNQPADQPAGGGGAPDKPADQKQKDREDLLRRLQNSTPKMLELTEEELNARVAAAVEAERKKTADAAKKQQEEADRKKAEEQGEWKSLADKAEERRTAAERERDEAKREAQLLRVGTDLRDYLAAEERRAYLNNAVDIMVHVEKKLTPDAKPEDAKKLIEAETAAFIARTGPVKPAPGAPAGGARGKLPAGTPIPPEQKANNGQQRRPYSTLNWHG